MKDPMETGERLPRIPLIVAMSVIFTISVVVSLWSFKIFSPLEIKRAVLPPEKPDPLGHSLVKTTGGLTNTQLAGRINYEKYCMVCHGEQGRGDGFNSFNLTPRPTNFSKGLPGNQALFKAASAGFTGSDGNLHCPPWGLTMGGDAIAATILYINTLAEKPPAAVLWR
ncbi:MAG: cytochrome c [Planctomycetota bacterium]